jgi:hypothetical protein
MNYFSRYPIYLDVLFKQVVSEKLEYHDILFVKYF